MGNKKKDVVVIVGVTNPEEISATNYTPYITFFDTRNDVQALGDPTSFVTYVDPDRSISWCAIITDPRTYSNYRVRLTFLDEKPDGGNSILKNLPLTDANEDGILVGKTNNNVTPTDEESYLMTLLVTNVTTGETKNIPIDPKLKGNP
ncbi:MAG: hypothetical protein KJO49_03815 [Bacteroidia bacterium]|nr:hypothetical protein [Bacteroidia bacterium]MBT8269217.1 hypothetical protein [Bacteroidia bacterium]NNF82779.1 hypothetical protein [Flavobacteriaceae bacterium]NNK70482.1 hypothetical protein [Flavobacteriaceae bacterium]NNL79997.1 hypothetical protein [Flavobacteriaceae bacterium]